MWRPRWPKLRWPKIDTHQLHDAAQGIFAIVGSIAILVGGVLYFAERRDKPRVILEPRTTVVGLTPEREGEGKLDAVLLQVSISIENHGSRGLTFNCPAIDIIGLRGAEQRQPTYMDDLAGTSLLPVNNESPNWMTCVHGFEQKRREQEAKWFKEQNTSGKWVNPPRPGGIPASGARYRDFFMEPGEIATRIWEQRVPCNYDAVRVIFKLPKPRSVQDYETKILVPIADVCANKLNVSILRYAPSAPATRSDNETGIRDDAAGSGALATKPR
jgi:hypothetical protein